MNECAICKKQKSLFELHMTADNGEEYTLYVCGTCWEVIAAIANKAMAERLAKIEERIDAIVPKPIDLDTITVDEAKRIIASGKESEIYAAVPKTLKTGGAWCGKSNKYICCRLAGHKGVHIALGSEHIVDTWQDGEA